MLSFVEFSWGSPASPVDSIGDKFIELVHWMGEDELGFTLDEV